MTVRLPGPWKLATLRTKSLWLLFLVVKVCGGENYRRFVADLCHNTSFLQGPPDRGVWESVVVVGDVHGAESALREVLERENITSASDSLCVFRASRVLLVQMGDVVDRGSRSFESWDCLSNLQTTAKIADSRVVRLMGNHESLWIQGDYGYRNQRTDTTEKIANLTAIIKNDILEDRLITAFSLETFKGVELFFSHAGLRPQMYNQLASRLHAIKGEKFPSMSQIASFINDKVVQDVKRCVENQVKDKRVAHCRFKDSLYSAGKDRGGYEIGGPLWTDWSVIASEPSSSMLDFPVIQIVGHTPAVGEIRTSSNLRAINVDVGMYMGGAGYLKIQPTGHFIAHSKSKGVWKSIDLTMSMCLKQQVNRFHD
jgi:hypothetical protein